MRLNRTLAIAASSLALAAGAAFAGEGPLTDRSDPMGYQPMESMDYQYFAQPQEYEVYDVYIVPAEEIVLIPLEQPTQAPIAGNELG